MTLDLTGVRQHLDEIATQRTVDREQLDEIATQLTLDHEQMTRDITRRLEAAEKNILDKIGSALPPRPTAAPVRSAH
jgi:hypothetical protein